MPILGSLGAGGTLPFGFKSGLFFTFKYLLVGGGESGGNTDTKGGLAGGVTASALLPCVWGTVSDVVVGALYAFASGVVPAGSFSSFNAVTTSNARTPGTDAGGSTAAGYGGGAGSGYNGSNGTYSGSPENAFGGAGGGGTSNSITGSSIMYAGGGGGGTYKNTSTGGAGTTTVGAGAAVGARGSGGNGGKRFYSAVTGNSYTNGTTGVAGTFILAVSLSAPLVVIKNSADTDVTPATTTAFGMRVYTLTTAGSYTIEWPTI